MRMDILRLGKKSVAWSAVLGLILLGFFSPLSVASVVRVQDVNVDEVREFEDRGSSFGSGPTGPYLNVEVRRPNPYFVPKEEDEKPTGPMRGVASSSTELMKSEVSSKVLHQERAVIAGDLGFFPRVLFVSAGIPVKLFVTGASRKALCLILDEFKVRREVKTREIEEVSFTPQVPGSYRFYCPVNGIEGTLLVKEPDWSSRSDVPTAALQMQRER